MLWAGKPLTPDEPTDESANRGEDNMELGNWRMFINLDIKPPNVCLGDSNPSYPGFKSIKMIDFGLCWPPDHSLFWEDRRRLRGVPGTYGWIPIEMMPGLEPEIYRNNPIHFASTVANIGLIALNLMEGRHLSYPEKGHNQRDYPELDNFTNQYKNMYSSTLRDFVFKCLLHNTKKRPGLLRMLHTSRVNIKRWQTINGDLSDKALEDLDERDRMIFRDGKWYVGPAGPQQTGPAGPGNQAAGNNNEDDGGNHDNNNNDDNDNDNNNDNNNNNNNNNNSNKRQRSPSGQGGPAKRQRTSRKTGVA